MDHTSHSEPSESSTAQSRVFLIAVLGWVAFYRKMTADDAPLQFAPSQSKIVGYFDRAVENAANMHGSEAALTHACLNPVVNLGGNIVLEDTSNAVKNFSDIADDNVNLVNFASDPNASKFRTLTFRRAVNDRSDRVDIVGRLPTYMDLGQGINQLAMHTKRRFQGNKVDYYQVQMNGALRTRAGKYVPLRLQSCFPEELPALKYHECNGKTKFRLKERLPPYRLCPWFIAMIIELKGPDVDIDNVEFIRQVAKYLEALLRTTPNRRIAFGALTNLKSVIFVAVKQHIGKNFKIYQTYYSLASVTDVGVELGMFCSTLPEFLGLSPELFSLTEFLPLQCLGRGSTATAVWGRSNGQELCLKVSNHPQSLRWEESVLVYLARRYSSTPLLVPVVREEATIHLRPHFADCCTALSERFTHVEEFEVEDFLSVWNTLCKVHSAGLVHRDIRTPNMMRRADGAMVLTDFSSAIFYGDNHLGALEQGFYEHTALTVDTVSSVYHLREVNTASNFVLLNSAVLLHAEPIDSESQIIFHTLPVDEACAVIYAAMFHWFPKTNNHFDLNQPVAFMVRTRNEWPDRIKGIGTTEHQVMVNTVQGALQYLENNREVISQNIDEMTAQVNTALTALYSYFTVVE